jgi:hypothetical protein
MAWRHHLAPAAWAADPAEVVTDLVALHSTDPASVFLSTMARTVDPSPDHLEKALYESRTVVRMLGMRRTMFVVAADLVPVVHAACTAAIAARERRRLVQMVEAGGIADDGAAWLAAVEAATLDALAQRGEAVGADLSRAVPELRRQLSFGAGTRWAGVQGLTTRVLFLLAADGRIVRGRPRGSWTSSQYHWAPVDAWLPGRRPAPDPAAASAELARRWLGAFGPATVADLRWWTGWTAAEAGRALAVVRPVEVDLDGAVGLLLPDDADAHPVRPEPFASLLPALDPTVMGWADRSWFLGQHRAGLFDRTGNAGPTVWWDGRVVGGWAQRKGGDIAVRLLEDVGRDAAGALDAAAARLQEAIGAVRVTPRFRTPLERELSA